MYKRPNQEIMTDYCRRRDISTTEIGGIITTNEYSCLETWSISSAHGDIGIASLASSWFPTYYNLFIINKFILSNDCSYSYTSENPLHDRFFQVHTHQSSRPLQVNIVFSLWIPISTWPYRRRTPRSRNSGANRLHASSPVQRLGTWPWDCRLIACHENASYWWIRWIMSPNIAM